MRIQEKRHMTVKPDHYGEGLMPPVDHPIHWTPPHPHRLPKKIRRRKGAI